MTKHIATAAVVKVSIGSPSGNSVAQFVRRGDLLPEGLDEAQLERLVKQGFVTEFEEPDVEDEPASISQADVDAAAAVVEAEARKVADEKKALDAEREAFAAEKTAFEQSKTEAAKPQSAAAAKSAGAKS